MSYQDQTKDELQDELRGRDLPVSGNKDELIDRLESDDSSSERTEGGDDGGSGSASDTGGGTASGSSSGSTATSSGGGGLKPLQLARRAAQQLEQVGGRRVDGTTGLEQTSEGWRVQLEVVEASRIPPSTDVLGTYEVVVDQDGDLLRYERIRRYVRAQAGEDQT